MFEIFSNNRNLSPTFITFLKWSEVKVKVAQSCRTLCDPMDHTVHGNPPGQNTGMGSLSLLQGIFPTQGSNLGLPRCRQTLYQLSHKEFACSARDPWVGKIPWKKEMATHSSTLAWKIPWMEEPGRLQSMGSQRARHNWMTSLSSF